MSVLQVVRQCSSALQQILSGLNARCKEKVDTWVLSRTVLAGQEERVRFICSMCCR
jgi:hypothetical protein